MLWLRLVYLFLAIFICSVGLGISIARRVFAEPKIALAATVGIAGIVLYLAAGAIYLTGISWRWDWPITAISAAALLMERRELRRWWNDPAARGMLIGWLLLELWIVLANLEIRHFAIWIGDWQEHYDRACFFLQHWAAARKVYGNYSIPARPPMMNLIEALFMGQSGSAYEFFQMAAGFFNGVLYLAVAGLAVEWGGKNMPRLVAALMALSPWFMQNATYPWTKLYSTFFAILGIWFYWRSLHDEQALRAGRLRFLAYLMLAAGCLVHYSVAIVAAFIALHDLLAHGRHWRRILLTWCICGLLLFTWIGWSVTTYGLHGIASSTTTVIEASQNSRSALAVNFLLNGAYSLIPRAILDFPVTLQFIHSPGFFWNKLRDVAFLCYEPGLLFSWGIGGLLAMAGALWAARHEAGKRFWIVMAIWIYFVGLLVCTPPSYYLGGVAHVLLQPVVWVGLAWLASRARRMPAWLVHVWWLGTFVDACWLMLHLILQGRVFPFYVQNGRYLPINPQAATDLTVANQIYQFRRGLRFLGMETVSWEALVLTALACGMLAWWWSLRRELVRGTSEP